MVNKRAILISSMLMLAASPALSKDKKPIIVAVIDTGISESLTNANFMCKMGHKDFTGTGLKDNHGHGTHISGLIDQYAKDTLLDKDPTTINKLLTKKANYCQVILKYYDPSRKFNNTNDEIEAIRYAIQIKVDYINLSVGGTAYSEEEDKLIKKALSKGIKIIVAAGNDHRSLDSPNYKFYPALVDSRLIIVGNLESPKSRAPSSNYGSKVNTWEIGTDQLSLSDDKHVISMTGTSQATAIKTGKLVHGALAH